MNVIANYQDEQLCSDAQMLKMQERQCLEEEWQLQELRTETASLTSQVTRDTMRDKWVKIAELKGLIETKKKEASIQGEEYLKQYQLKKELDQISEKITVLNKEAQDLESKCRKQ
jgi:hypothetical protein